MQSFTLQARIRLSGSRNTVRRMRRLDNQIPAVLYGGKGEPIPLTLGKGLVDRYAQEESFFTSVLTLVVDNDEQPVIVKDVQRHPWRREIHHLDLLRVEADRELHLSVPIHFNNTQTSAGVRAGGIVNHLLNELDIRCLPKDIPEYIGVDIAELEMDHTLHVSDIKLPEGVELTHGVSEDNDPGIVVIHAPRVEVVEEAAPEAEAQEEVQEEKEE